MFNLLILSLIFYMTCKIIWDLTKKKKSLKILIKIRLIDNYFPILANKHLLII